MVCTILNYYNLNYYKNSPLGFEPKPPDDALIIDFNQLRKAMLFEFEYALSGYSGVLPLH